ncbi:MAG: glycosyl transferase family 2 [Acidobacteria bacterium]|nr:MAG: glycosyl transferase family 2 [Acidobacteriota bacterium]
MQEDSSFHSALAVREQYRDAYWRKHDPIAEDRLLWRAQTFRHAVHLLPGQTVLELGCGQGFFTRALLRVSRGENPITVVTFQRCAQIPFDVEREVELLAVSDLPESLSGRGFDYVVAMDLLDRSYASKLLAMVHALLAPGGELVFYESNPRNPILQLRRIFLRMLGKPDPRHLLSRSQIHNLASEIGFISAYAIYNDFVFPPLTRRLIWLLRNLSILLENAPGVRTMAGSIFLHAQKPPGRKHAPRAPLFTHKSLRGAVSFVIPCHNEEMNIRPLVGRILDLYRDYVHEIILVNDGSNDGTATVIEEIGKEDARVKPLHRNPPSGVGRAIAQGFSQTNGRYVLSMDCDFQHLLPEFRDLFDGAVEGYDVVVGSRFSRHSVLLNYPFLKIVANRGFHLLARLVLRRNFRDLTNNLKLMRREVVVSMQLREPGFAVNAETGLQPLILGYRVKEVPISWINRSPGMGASSFRLVRVGGGYWRVLLGIWLKQTCDAGAYVDLRRKPTREQNDKKGAGASSTPG